MGAIKRVCLVVLVLSLLYFSAQKLEKYQNADGRMLGGVPRFRTDVLPFLSLGQPALLSDLLMARALSYYGANRFSKDKTVFDGLFELFSQAFILDPDNSDLVLFGANTLLGFDISAAISLLELGMRYRPDYWKYPEMTGFIYYYHQKDSFMAARYYERASHLPGHPPFVPSISSKLYEESGFFDQAIGVLKNLAHGSRSDNVRQGFEERIQSIEERIRLKRFRVPTIMQSVISGTRVGLKMNRFNPYPELAASLLLDLSWQTPKVDEGERAIMCSVWRQRLGGEVLMQLNTDQGGQFIMIDDAFQGILLGDGGENLSEKLIRSVRQRPILRSGSPWQEYDGQVVQVCGFFQEVRADGEDLVLIWREADLPHGRITNADQGVFAIENWSGWLENSRQSAQSISALLTFSLQNQAFLHLLHPAQIKSCADTWPPKQKK